MEVRIEEQSLDKYVDALKEAAAVSSTHLARATILLVGTAGPGKSSIVNAIFGKIEGLLLCLLSVGNCFDSLQGIIIKPPLEQGPL